MATKTAVIGATMAIAAMANVVVKVADSTAKAVVPSKEAVKVAIKAASVAVVVAVDVDVSSAAIAVKAAAARTPPRHVRTEFLIFPKPALYGAGFFVASSPGTSAQEAESRALACSASAWIWFLSSSTPEKRRSCRIKCSHSTCSSSPQAKGQSDST